jgi:hypothetical protein
MSHQLTLSTAPYENPSMDYAFLRQEGIRHLERMAGQLWTDFNAHDPGITILEQLCYAITDLGYRIDFDLKDLLASGEEDPYRSLFSPAEILTTNPVTLTDFRKVVIDVAGVKNAWLEPVTKPEPAVFYDPSSQCLYLEEVPHRDPVSLQGIYRVLIEADPGLPVPDLGPRVSRRLHACRNLCEDFLPPIILRGQGITVNANIEIGEIEDPELLLAEIYHAVAEFISPRIHFYSLAEMLEKGKRIDEILDGPILRHGFIDTGELEGYGRKEALRSSDLIQKIMDVTGVIAVSDFSLADETKTETWYLELDRARAPFLDIDKSLFDKKIEPCIQLVRGRVPADVKADKVKMFYDGLQKSARKEPLPESRRDVRLSAGRERRVGCYHSIQHHFPANYGIGEFGLPASASARRKAQARQLKAYLMFFDQLLSNYFAQLANVNELFSFYSEAPRTYFWQLIDDPGLKLDEDQIWVNSQETLKNNLRSIAENPGTDPEREVALPDCGRKNRFLNHLLARFAEEFTDYSLLQYASGSPEELIADKCAFLRDYREIGGARGRAFNYSLPSWNTENVSGLEKRISRKLGQSTYRKRELAGMKADEEGGFHLLEHILLRPRQADRDQWTRAAESVRWQAAALLAQPRNKDPYSRQLSFIFPDWIKRYGDSGFRDFIWKTLREETPAHLNVHLHWLNQKEMRHFEAAYKDWLNGVIAQRLWTQAT